MSKGNFTDKMYKNIYWDNHAIHHHSPCFTFQPIVIYCIYYENHHEAFLLTNWVNTNISAKNMLLLIVSQESHENSTNRKVLIVQLLSTFVTVFTVDMFIHQNSKVSMCNCLPNKVNCANKRSKLLRRSVRITTLSIKPDVINYLIMKINNFSIDVCVCSLNSLFSLKALFMAVYWSETWKGI